MQKIEPGDIARAEYEAQKPLSERLKIPRGELLDAIPHADLRKVRIAIYNMDLLCVSVSVCLSVLSQKKSFVVSVRSVSVHCVREKICPSESQPRSC